MAVSGDGVLTLAYGRKYAQMAIDLALSLREYSEVPVSVVVDGPANRLLRKFGSSVFQHIIPIDDRIHPWGGKLVAALRSPYERTVFVDADVIFISRFDWFNTFTQKAAALYGCYMFPYHDFFSYYPSTQIFADFGVKRYFQATSGIFQFHRPAADQYFRECVDFYKKGIRKLPGYDIPGVADEFVLGIVADRFDIGSIPCDTAHPWPQSEQFSSLAWEDHRWPVVHVFGRINDTYMEQLIRCIDERRQRARLPVVSGDIWRRRAAGVPEFSEKFRHLCGRVARATRRWFR